MADHHPKTHAHRAENENRLMLLPSSAAEPTRCPLCGGENRCAMELERATGEPQPPCWCTGQRFSPALLARLPPAAAGKACICAGCLATFRTEVNEAPPG